MNIIKSAMTEERRKVAKQHFVPKFYLSRFTNPQGLLERLELESGTLMTKPTSPSSECVEQYFYAVETGKEDEVSQEIEEFWKVQEDYVGERLGGVEQRIVEGHHLDDGDIFVLASLGAMLWMRTPMFRETMNFNIGKLEKQLYQRRASLPEYTDEIMKFSDFSGLGFTREKAEKLRQFILDGKYSVSFNNVPHLQLIVSAFENFRNMFGHAKWRLYVTGGSRRFVTSTSPCIEIFPERKGFYGPSFYDRQKLFPISPKVLAEIQLPLMPGKKTKRRMVDNAWILEHNIKQANWSILPGARSRCYANRIVELEELVEIRKEVENPELLKLIARHAINKQSDL